MVYTQNLNIKDPIKIKTLLKDFTAETTPFSADKIDSFREILRPNTKIYVTFLPESDFKDTIRISRRLKTEGFIPIPHLAARSIKDLGFLDDAMNCLTSEAGVDEVLCIAGARDKPLGDFSNSMELLETGIFDKYKIKTIGVAGHPEGCPDISNNTIQTALNWKNKFHLRTNASLYIITQFCFEPEPIIAWDKKIRELGNVLPIRLGVPGVASLKTLLSYANACGIGQSIKFLKKQAMNISKLLTTSTPDKLITDIARYKSENPSCGIVGIHMYPLGGIRQSANWAYKVVDGNFVMTKKETGFTVNSNF